MEPDRLITRSQRKDSLVLWSKASQAELQLLVTTGMVPRQPYLTVHEPAQQQT